MKVRRQHHHSAWGFAQFLFLIPESVMKRASCSPAFTREMPEATEISDRTGPRVDGGELRDGRGELRLSE